MIRIWNAIVFHALPATVALLLTSVAVFTLDRRTPVTTILGPIIPPIVQPGQVAELHFSVEKYFDYEGNIRRWLVDSKGIIYSLSDVPAEPGLYGSRGKIRVVRDFPIPRGISPGPATYHSRAALWRNPFQQWLWPLLNEYEYPFIVQDKGN